MSASLTDAQRVARLFDFGIAADEGRDAPATLATVTREDAPKGSTQRVGPGPRIQTPAERMRTHG